MKNGMIRLIVDSVTAAAGKLMRFSGKGRAGESIEDREILQQYGFQSRPKKGAEAVVIREGNHFLMIASDDRRYRIGLKEGEVAISTDEGDKIHFKRGKQIDIESGGTININGNSEVNIASLASVNITAMQVKAGQSAILDTAQGVLTLACPCSIVGAPHAVASQTVKATL